MNNLRKDYRLALVFVLLLTTLNTVAQQGAPTSVTAQGVVPRLVSYSGFLKDASGRTLTSITGVTFLLYKDQEGGAPIWLETQNVTPDKTGHFTVQLGAASKDGAPPDLFVTGEARWLGLQIGSEPEQPRTMLVAVPYAMKAMDAETIGGLPPSAFMLANPPASSAATGSTDTIAAGSTVPPPTASNVTTTGGTANTIPLFTTATNIQNSILTQTGTTAINVGGRLNLPATGTATTTAGKNSQSHTFVASVFNSGTAAAVPQTFQLQAEPAGNDTSTASGTLNLLYGSGTATPAETGLKISNKGLIAFATGQTFPGTATGTVKNVGSGAGLTGGPITGTGTLSIAIGGVSNGMLQHPSLTVTAGTALIGGGTVSLGGSATLNLDTTKVPLLASNNAFTGNNEFTGSVGVGTTAPTHVFEVDAPGATVAQMAMVSTGTDAAISLNNAASGGREYWIDSGSGTAGVGAGNFAVWDATAGAARLAINLGGNVGVGTTLPYTKLHLRQDNSGTLGPSLTLMNAAGGAGSGGSVDFDGYDTTIYSPTVRIQSIDDGNASSNLTFQTKTPGAISNSLVEQVRISDYGSLIVDSSHNNAGSLSDSSAAGTGLEFGGSSSGEGIASCRSNTSCPVDSNGYSTQYGIDFYTNHTRRVTIENGGVVDIEGDSYIAGCTYWGNGNNQGSCVSDARLKTNIQPFPPVLDKLVQLEPVHFDWRASVPPELHRRGANQTGFVAQQVEKFFPEMVTMGKDGYRRVNYGLLPYLLLQGVRELKESNDNLNANTQRLRQQNEKARAEITKLRKAAAATEARFARLDRAAAAKDARIGVMSRQIEQLRQAQERMAVLLARVASPESERGKQSAEVRPTVKQRRARASGFPRQCNSAVALSAFARY